VFNVYSFNATVISNKDKRERKRVSIKADAATLNRAWDKAERKAATKYPDHTVTLTVGNHQPVHLRAS
jgi:hypothetical protein